jgi:hypothetical protein
VVGLLAAALAVLVVTWDPVAKRLAAKSPYVMVKKAELRKQRLSDRAFGKRCLAMSQAIHDLVGNYKRSDPRTLRWATSEMMENRDEQQREENRHRAEIEGRFAERYQAETAWLLTETIERDYMKPSEMWPVSIHHGMTVSIDDIERIAGVLGIVGNRLTAVEDGSD